MTKFTPILKKVSKSHQENIHTLMVEYEGKYPNLSPSDIMSKMMENNSQLFSGTKTKGQSISFDKTDKTVHFPSLTLKSRGNKNTKHKYTNVTTEPMRKMQSEWKVLTEPIFKQLARTYSSSHPFGDFTFDERK